MELEIVKDLFCSQCSLQFGEKFMYDQHLSNVHQPKDDRKSDDSKVFNEKAEKSFKCKKSGANFPCKSKRGTKQFEPVNERKKAFNCEICYAKFNRSDGLKLHIESVHEGKKPFKCEICDVGFTQHVHLKTHIASVHERKRPFKCEICNTGFTQHGHLKTHIASVHERRRPFTCKTCGASFVKQRFLKKEV